MEQFPPNNPKANAAAQGPKVERVTSAQVVRRRQPLGKQFAHTFFRGSARTALGYAVESVVIPAVRDVIAESISSIVEKIVYGEPRSRRGGAPPSAYGRVNYAQQSQTMPHRNQPSRDISPKGRASHDFGELVMQSRAEADEVLSQMFDILNQYEMVLVSDLYALCGIPASHVDHQWGWTSLQGAQIGRVRGGGYLLDLPRPKPMSR